MSLSPSPRLAHYDVTFLTGDSWRGRQVLIRPFFGALT